MAAPLARPRVPRTPQPPTLPPPLLVSSLWSRVSCHFSSVWGSVSHNKEKGEIFIVPLSVKSRKMIYVRLKNRQNECTVTDIRTAVVSEDGTSWKGA